MELTKECECYSCLVIYYEGLIGCQCIIHIHVVCLVVWDYKSMPVCLSCSKIVAYSQICEVSLEWNCPELSNFQENNENFPCLYTSPAISMLMLIIQDLFLAYHWKIFGYADLHNIKIYHDYSSSLFERHSSRSGCTF